MRGFIIYNIRMIKLSKEKGKKIGLAVSGGADSMVMLHLYMEAQADIVVINVEHGIRGEASVEDSEFVRAFCVEHGIPCRVVGVNAPEYAQKHGLGIELAARTLRYKVFDEMLASKEVDCIALAHHMDDQVETIFMRLLRGTGIRGIRGIVDRPGYIHPLLGVTRDEIKAYAEEHDIKYREDATNLESAYTRNYLRHEVLPSIKVRFPQYAKAIIKLGKAAEETEDYMMGQIVRATKEGDGIGLPISVLDAHPAIAKKSIAEALRSIGCDHDIESTHLTALVKLKDAENGAKINLPFGYDAYRSYDRLRIIPRRERCTYNEKFDLGTEYAFGGYRYSFVEYDAIVKGLTFDAESIPEGAVVRTREEGDRFRRCGGREKKLSDYLTDIKIPRYMRDKLLLIACGQKVYAILGVEISDEVKITESTQKIYKIEIGEDE